MLYLSREDISKVITMKEVIASVKKAFEMVAEDTVDIPLRTKIPAPKTEGEFLFMPAYAESLDAAAVKVINIFSKNIEKGLISAPAQTMLIDGKTGYVQAILDGNYVTQLRTGASSGVAFELLAKKDAKIGGMIGTGGQATTQLEAMICACDLEEVKVYDLNRERLENFCKAMNEQLGHYGTKITPADSADDATVDADVFITVTPSPKPVFDGTKIKPGCTISCVGTYEPHKHEMDPAVLPRTSKIYCDSVSAALAETGDLLIPMAEGIISEADITGNIGDVSLGKIVGRENDEEIIVYETVGVAAQDLCAAKVIYDRAVELGIGIELK
ncbi:MAG: ornithine cyclodeaminase family protein [Lachnospiraceae bacterium]